MNFRRVKFSLLFLAGLVVSSYAFFVGAQENSTTRNNIFIDSDQDGLSDSEEKLYGTNPKNSDTDGDGYSDGAEIKSGYNPLKPAPGDKIIASADAGSPAKNASPQNASGDNLTRQVAQKVVSITSASDSDDQQITLEQVQNIVDETLNQTLSASDLPLISPDEIKIKKQNYSKLPETEAAKKKKEDFTNYLVAVYYILASNSPEPIHSSDTFSGLVGAITSEITSAIRQQNPDRLSGLSDFGQKALSQLEDVEVPEDMADIHIKTLQFAKYAITLKDFLKSNAADPLSDLAQYSKIEAFLQTLLDFSSQVMDKLNFYGLQMDDALVGKINGLGVEVPQIDAATANNPANSNSDTANNSSTGQ